MVSHRGDSSAASNAHVEAGLVTRSPSWVTVEKRCARSSRPCTPRPRGARCGCGVTTSRSRSGSKPSGSGAPHAAAAVHPVKAAEGVRTPAAASARARTSCRMRRSCASGAASSKGRVSGRRRAPWKGRSRSPARKRRGETPAARAWAVVNPELSDVGRGRGVRGIPTLSSVDTLARPRSEASVEGAEKCAPVKESISSQASSSRMVASPRECDDSRRRIRRKRRFAPTKPRGVSSRARIRSSR